MMDFGKYFEVNIQTIYVGCVCFGIVLKLKSCLEGFEKHAAGIF